LVLQLAYSWQALTLEGSPFKQDKVRNSRQLAATPGKELTAIRLGQDHCVDLVDST
jgi:hypothetical protein